jgi:threonine/homoserine/homoserine lactone efflux protein
MIENILLIGLLTGLITPILSLSKNLLVAKKISAEAYLGTALFITGNIVVQIIWVSIAALAMFSVNKIIKYEELITFLGSVFVLYICYYLYKVSFAKGSEENGLKSQTLKDFFSFGMIIAMSAPQSIFLYIGFYTGFEVHYDDYDLIAHMPLILSTVLGIVIFYIIYYLAIFAYKHKMTNKTIFLIGRVSCIFLALLALIPIVKELIKISTN